MKITKAKKRKCLVSGYPTYPNILGPTQTFLKTFGILKSIFRLFLKVFILFTYFFIHVPIPGRVAQSVTCLATDACLTADPGVASSIPVRSHIFVEIDSPPFR